MRVFLMYEDRDFDLEQPLPPNTEDITHDLALEVIWHTMAQEDDFLHGVARVAMLSGVQTDIPTILHRQQVLEDCLQNREVVMEIYRLVVDSIEKERREFWGFSRYPAAILSRSVGVLKMFLERLIELRDIADRQQTSFHSPGFTKLFSMLQQELSDDYFAEVKNELKNLSFRDGVQISAALGSGNRGTGYVLREPGERERMWLRLLRKVLRRDEPQTYYLHPRDEAGANALSDLRSRGINLVANAVGQSADHILDFFKLLRAEIAFYLGCLNLYDRLTLMGEPVCFPRPEPVGCRKQAFDDLYDVSLALSLGSKVVGNRVNAGGSDLVVITGANQGGKSTFLRSVGLAQLMMQTGMFVGAQSFEGELCHGIFTHYKREEDAAMESGKFDEEISRMDVIANQIRANAMMLFNESFAATNELEGSEVALQIVTALLQKKIKVVFVTHQYELAHRLALDRSIRSLFLCAERREDGSRTFKLIEGEPLRTSFGEDLYDTIFGRQSESQGSSRERIPVRRA